MKRKITFLLAIVAANIAIAQTGKVFITNEGSFSGTGAVTVYDRATGTPTQNAYQAANSGFTLGSILQSVNVYNGKAYFVVNNGSKVEVADASTLVSTGTINGLSSPRYFVPASPTKAYVSDWVSNTVAVVNLANNTISSTIAVGNSPEHMVITNGKLYVANSGAFSIDNTVSVIDISLDVVIATITLDDAPTSLQVDMNGDVWVLCAGDPAFTGGTPTAGSLNKIDPSTDAVTLTMPFASTAKHPGDLVINATGTALFYLDQGYGGNVFVHDIATSVIDSSSAFISGAYYEIGLDPVTDEIFAADAKDFSQNGDVTRYDALTGASIATFGVGVIPGGFYFSGSPSIGTEELTNAMEVKTYPNPATDYVMVEVEARGAKTVQLFDMNGAVVNTTTINSNTLKMDVSGLAKGTYVLSITTEFNQYNQQIIIR